LGYGSKATLAPDLGIRYSSNVMAVNVIKIPGDYQYRAWTKGSPIRRFWYENKINLVKWLNLVDESKVVLDAGCGSGVLTLHLMNTCKSVYALDSNKEALSFLHNKIKQAGRGNSDVKFINADLRTIPLEDNLFDIVFLYEVVEHFSGDDLKLMTREIRRVLKKGGYLVLTTPNYHSFWPLLEFLIDFFHLGAVLRGEQHITLFNPPKLTDFLSKNGFRTKKMGTFNYLAPFTALISLRLANQLSKFEFERGKSFGPSIFVVAQKKPVKSTKPPEMTRPHQNSF